MTEIREYRPGDRTEVLGLFVDHPDAFYPPLYAESFGLGDDQDRDELSDAAVIRANVGYTLDMDGARAVVAVEDGAVVGALLTSIRARLDSMDGEMDPCAYVYLVLVDRDHRRQGLAREMLRYWIREILPAADCSWAALRAQVPNTASRSLITSMGFEEFKRLEEQGYEHIYYRSDIEELLERYGEN